MTTRSQPTGSPPARTAAAIDRELAALAGEPHRRYDPLRDEWVLVSAERTRRPWQGRREPSGPRPERLAYDPECYLCPGNRRAGGEANPDYDATYVFTNDFAALRPETRPVELRDGLLRAETEPGTCRVICFSRRHDLTLAEMSQDDVRRVIDLWADQTAELGERFQWVQVFENRGEIMGASNPHPHGQIWAGTALPDLAAREDRSQERYLETRGRPLLLDYVEQEAGGSRVVVANDHWLGVVPFWAAWPFETMLIARHPAQRLPELSGPQRDDLAAILIQLLGAYDQLFDLSFPYSMGWHQAPFRPGSGDEPHWQLHAHFFPPLLGATMRKFMVGYELLAETQRDLTAEQAAERLRDALRRSRGSRAVAPTTAPVEPAIITE